MKATLQFETGKPRYNGGKGVWTMTREFKDMRHLDNFIDYICRTKNYLLDEVWYTSYPFNEGDTYYTVAKNSKGTYEVVESTWDWVSEEIFDENPNRYMTWSRKKANDYVEKLNEGLIKIYQ